MRLMSLVPGKKSVTKNAPFSKTERRENVGVLGMILM
jgi:hypothetical protein